MQPIGMKASRITAGTCSPTPEMELIAPAFSAGLGAGAGSPWTGCALHGSRA
jgi:hypothetical protein